MLSSTGGVAGVFEAPLGWSVDLEWAHVPGHGVIDHRAVGGVLGEPHGAVARPGEAIASHDDARKVSEQDSLGTVDRAGIALKDDRCLSCGGVTGTVVVGGDQALNVDVGPSSGVNTPVASPAKGTNAAPDSGRSSQTVFRDGNTVAARGTRCVDHP